MLPVVTPEWQALIDANKHLRAEIADLLAASADLIKIVKPHLLALYQTKLGPWELDLIRAQCEAAKGRRRLELIRMALNRGLVPDLAAIEKQLEEEFLSWKLKMKEAADELTAAHNREPSLLSVAETKELKKLYFALVKQLHPDLNPQLSVEMMCLWERVQDAYSASDLEKLRDLSLLAPAAEAHNAADSLDKLAAENTLLRQRIGKVRGSIAELKQQPPFHLEANLNNEEWVKSRRDEIELAVEKLMQQASALEAELIKHLPSHSHVPGKFSSN